MLVKVRIGMGTWVRVSDELGGTGRDKDRVAFMVAWLGMVVHMMGREDRDLVSLVSSK